MTEEDARLRSLLRVFLRQLKKAEKAKEFPVFSPLQTWIDSSGVAQLKIVDTTPDISRSLKSVGVAIYHLQTGESEATKESYLLDGYDNRPINSEFWPLLQLLLSGHAKDLFLIQDKLSWRNQFAYWLGENMGAVKKHLAKIKFHGPRRFVKGGELSCPECGEQNQHGWQRNFRQAGNSPKNEQKKLSVFLQRTRPWRVPLASILVSVSAVMIFGFAGWQFYQTFDAFESRIVRNISLVAAILLIIVLIKYIFSGVFKDGPRLLNSFIFFFCSLVLSLVLSLVGSLSFSLTPPQFDQAGNQIQLVVIDRESGEFLNRLVKDDGVRNTRFNLFRQQIVRGVPLAGSVYRSYHLVYSAKKYDLPVEVNYRLDVFTDNDYRRAFNSWRSQEKLENDLRVFLDGFGRELNMFFVEQLNSMKDADGYDPEMTQLRLIDFLRKKLAEKGLSCDQLTAVKVVCYHNGQADVCGEKPLFPEDLALISDACEHPEKRVFPFVQLSVR